MTEVSVSKEVTYSINIGGDSWEISEEEARGLYHQLSQLFAKDKSDTIKDVDKIIEEINKNKPAPQPVNPWDYPYGTRPFQESWSYKPIPITCNTVTAEGKIVNTTLDDHELINPEDQLKRDFGALVSQNLEMTTSEYDEYVEQLEEYSKRGY